MNNLGAQSVFHGSVFVAWVKSDLSAVASRGVWGEEFHQWTVFTVCPLVKDRLGQVKVGRVYYYAIREELPSISWLLQADISVTVLYSVMDRSV